jgi:hypothetical protein
MKPMMRNRLVLLILVLVMGIMVLVSCDMISKLRKPARVQWEKTFGKAEHDKGVSVKQTEDGNFIICGIDNTFNLAKPQAQRAYLLEVDKEGNLLWEEKYDNDHRKQHVWMSEVLQASDGGFIMVGTVSIFDDPDPRPFSAHSHNDILVIKTDRSGKLQWRKNYGAERDEEGYSLRQARSGDYIISGIRESYEDGKKRFWEYPYILKIDSKGNLLWSKAFPSIFSLENALIEMEDECILISGSSFADTNDICAYLMKTNKDGDLLWVKTYGENGIEEYVRSIDKTPEGDYVLAGYSCDPKFKIILNTGCGTCDYSVPNDSTDAYILKTDSCGSVIWERSYGGQFLLETYSLSITNDSCYAVAGCIDTAWGDPSDLESCGWNRDAFIMKLD